MAFNKLIVVVAVVVIVGLIGTCNGAMQTQFNVDSTMQPEPLRRLLREATDSTTGSTKDDSLEAELDDEIDSNSDSLEAELDDEIDSNSDSLEAELDDKPVLILDAQTGAFMLETKKVDVL